MDLREWLTAVALRNGSTPSNTRHYHGFAGNVRKDFPRLPCSEATAHAVGGELGGQFPTWDELREAIRGVMTQDGAYANEPQSEESRMTAKWVGFYRRRMREAPERVWHLLSLLRKVDMAAFREVDDGTWAQSEARFDRQFWEDRGGHTRHDPRDYRAPADTVGRIQTGYQRSARVVPAPAEPSRPPSSAMRQSVLIEQYRAMAEQGNQVAAARLATMEQP